VFEGETAYQYIIRDITQRKEFEKEMSRLSGLNLIGEMAAGIGHEIRNPMTTVRGFLQILGGKEECTNYKEYFDLMIDELDRANSIITEFLKLARNKPVEKKLFNLNDVIKTLLPLIQSDAMKSDKYIVLELEEIPDLLLDEKEIRQVIFNLVRNGLEASPPGSDLTIRTFTDGDDVVLAIQDNGEGISPDVLEKIGTPFYTNKDNGTGLGLAVCYSIVARHNAKIEIETGVNGTTFFIRLKQLEQLEQPYTSGIGVQTVLVQK
jgi:signal transduction histidine kinase